MTDIPKCPQCGGEATFQDVQGTYWDSNAHYWRIPAPAQGGEDHVAAKLAPPTPENAQVTQNNPWPHSVATTNEIAYKLPTLEGAQSDVCAMLDIAIERDYPQMPPSQRAHIALTLLEPLLAHDLQAARDSAVSETLEAAVNCIPLSGISSDKIKQIKAAIRALSPASERGPAKGAR